MFYYIISYGILVQLDNEYNLVGVILATSLIVFYRYIYLLTLVESCIYAQAPSLGP